MPLNLVTSAILLLRFLETFPEVRRFIRNATTRVMVDEYQDTNHTQERMLDLLSRGQNRFMVGDWKRARKNGLLSAFARSHGMVWC